MMRDIVRYLRADDWNNFSEMGTDQQKEIAPPPIEKPIPKDANTFDLVDPEEFTLGSMPLVDAIRQRHSQRNFADESLTFEELSYLLWATQGIRNVVESRGASLRVVPSGGARHPFETYLIVFRVEGLEPGLYRYSALEHKLVHIPTKTISPDDISQGCRGQGFVGKSAVVFVWSTIPYRSEWRYGSLSAKMIAQDSGHVCQNLYLAATSIGAGTCAIGAYDQDAMDKILDLDGETEFVVYVAPVGK
ncbi:MAG: SagB/ThcOx family dehydrogenase [Candidatus Thorarchaeota archaeon]|nr:SagB/ThcOx family dehydrogenase [Candidatus Thorarchaeota archaeon]